MTAAPIMSGISEKNVKLSIIFAGKDEKTANYYIK